MIWKSTSEKKSTLRLLVNQILISLVFQYLCGENTTLKSSSLIIMLLILNTELAEYLGLEKYHNLWKRIFILVVEKKGLHATPNYGPGKSKFEVYCYKKTYCSPEKLAHKKKWKNNIKKLCIILNVSVLNTWSLLVMKRVTN